MEPQSDQKGSIDTPEFVAALKAGDAAAWQLICEKLGQPLYLYVYYRAGCDANLAEDVRQETFLAAVQAIAGYRGEVPLFGWLCGIARHKLIDSLRRSQRQISLAETDEGDGYAQNTASAWNNLDSVPLPQETVEAAETCALVVEALWTLPDDHRQALVNRYVRGESVDVIAARLHRSYKATESLLSRARQSIRSRLLELTRHDPE